MSFTQIHASRLSKGLSATTSHFIEILAARHSGKQPDAIEA